MIELYTGKPGSGKTYALTKRVMQALDRGYTVYANYDIVHGRALKEGRLHRWRDLEDIYHVKNGIIAMDEAHVYMNSRKWDALPDEMQVRLQQHRKDALHIWGTAQSERRLDTVYRELVQRWYVCKKLAGSGEDDPLPAGEVRKERYVWGIIWVREMDADDMDNKLVAKRNGLIELFSGGQFLWISKYNVSAYTTQQKVEQSERPPIRVMHLKRMCEHCGELPPKHVG